MVQIHILDVKQCRSRSVGFFRSQLIWIYTVCKGRVYLGLAGQGYISLIFREKASYFMPTPCIADDSLKILSLFFSEKKKKKKKKQIRKNILECLCCCCDCDSRIYGVLILPCETKPWPNCSKITMLLVNLSKWHTR